MISVAAYREINHQKLDAHLYHSLDDVLRHALDDWQAYERRGVLKGLEQARQGAIALLDRVWITREARAQCDEQYLPEPHLM